MQSEVIELILKIKNTDYSKMVNGKSLKEIDFQDLIYQVEELIEKVNENNEK